MEIGKELMIIRDHIISPRSMRRHSDGRVSSWATLHGELNVIGVWCYEITPVLVDPGDGMHEPPIWDVDYIGSLYIKPIMQCWGKGVT